MKFEQAVVRGGRPIEETPLNPPRVPTTDARREVRVLTDVLILEAINTNTDLTEKAADVMLGLAEALNKHHLDPTVVHFIGAARGLIETGRTIFDAGMRVDDWEGAQQGAVMIELAIRGMFNALELDYEAEISKRHLEQIGEENGTGQGQADSVSRGNGDHPGAPEGHA